MTRSFINPVAVVCAGALIVAAALAGDLNPPAGAVAPTMKTLVEIEPRTAINAANTPGDADSQFKITQKGSYYLTGNITGVIGKHGIEIAASGVTVDLNGFDLLGLASLGGVIVTLGNQNNIAVLNGSVRNWGDGGVNLGTATNCRVEGVLASGSTGNTDGIIVGAGSTVFNCSAFNNTGAGLATGAGCTVSNCSAFQNSGNGINVGFGVGTGCTITGCSSYQNTGDGIAASSGCTIVDCTAESNDGDGVEALFGCTITNCSIRNNARNGIRVSRNCLVRGNACATNGSGGDGAGIHATSDDNRIEGNNCTDADRGIDVDASGNIIIRNTCSGNTTNWDVAVGNVCLVVSATTNGVAISGNSGGAAPGSTDPNANFTY